MAFNPLHTFRIAVQDDERAILRRDGRFVRLLEPGRYTEFDPRFRMTADVHKVVRSELKAELALLLEKTQPQVAAENIRIVQPGPNEIAIVSFDGEPKHLVLPSTTRAFWKTLTHVEVEMIDAGAEMRIAKAHLDKLDLARTSVVKFDIVGAHEAGLLMVDGKLVERLEPGRHAFWEIGRKVEIRRVDLRPQLLEVTAQEILTKDRVGIRVTLTAFYKVIDPVKAAVDTANLHDTLYRLVQFAVREAVATRTLDEILAARDELDGQVRNFVASRAGELGIEVGEIGIKDVILPGDVRELLNKVVEAERVAKANLIRRQEETAATRSLLNTSRLMEDNPLLLRLKELEALEKLVEKVGRIDLHAGKSGGLDALLEGLYRLREQDGEDGGKA